MFTDSISMRMKRKLWITLVFCLPLLCADLFAQPRSSETRQNSLVSHSKRNTETDSKIDSREVVTPAKAGVQHERNKEINSQMDSRLRGNDRSRGNDSSKVLGRFANCHSCGSRNPVNKKDADFLEGLVSLKSQKQQWSRNRGLSLASQIDSRLRENDKQATGIILSFNKWPSKRVQNKISKALKKENLKLTKKFESFQSLVFSWEQIQAQKRAESICLKLSKLKNLKYCEPDMILHPNNVSSNSETEAGAISCTVDCYQMPHNLSILQDTFKAITPGSCELLPSKHQLKDGTLSDYWAQEMVGADLLREEIKKAEPLPEDKFLISVIDRSIDDHDVHVRNIISHEEDQAVLPALSSSQIHVFDVLMTNFYMIFSDAIKRRHLSGYKNIPSFINHSMIWEESQAVYEAMSQIHPPAILVKGAGNDYPRSLDSRESQFSKDFDGIIVGSLSPNGFVSEFSQEGEEVHILAPSDHWITSVGSDGSYERFSGTSGATPLVTGSLAGFEWLSGYHPTASEAKLLLEQTAIPTIHSVLENPRRNGVGMLNAYKLGMVGKRLKEKCHDNEECFQREIQNPDNYEFSINAENILEQVYSTFPECSNQPNETPTSCEDKRSAFKNLRQAILLDIENVNLLEKLHCIYEKEGFLENATHINSTIASVTKDEDQMLEHLKPLIQNSPEDARRKLELIIDGIGEEKKLRFLRNLLDQNSSDQIKIQLILAMWSILEEEERLKLEKQLF